MNLDLIDRKILYEFGKDSRLSYKKIAKNINSKKEVVAYHLNRLTKKGVINKFVPVFDLSKLNIFSNKIYLRLKGLNKESEEKLYKNLIKNKKIAWVARSVGRWDLLLGMYSRNIIEFSKMKQEILSDLSKYIQDYDVTLIEEGIVFNRDYLTKSSTDYRKEFVFGGGVDNIELNEKEIKIIREIRNNARFTILDIALKLSLDSRTVMNTIKGLSKKKVLQGYTIFLDLKKIDFQLHKLCIYLQNYNKNKLEELILFLKQNPHTIHVIKALGSWEFEIEIESGNIQEIYDYINELKNRFPKSIKQIDLVTITDELKLELFPESY